MNSETIKHNIEANLRNFDQQPLREAATILLQHPRLPQPVSRERRHR